MVDSDIAKMGYEAGIKRASETKRIGWALKGTPPRKSDMRLTALQAISEGRKLRDQISKKLAAAGIDPAEGVVQVVFALPDLTKWVPKLATLSAESAMTDVELAAHFNKLLPIGFLVWIKDPDPKKPTVYGHKRPLIVSDKRSLVFNEAAYRASEKQLRASLEASGELPDSRN